MEKTIKSNSPAFEGSSQVCKAPPGPFLHGVNSSFDLPGMVRVELIEKPFGSLFQMQGLLGGRWGSVDDPPSGHGPEMCVVGLQFKSFQLHSIQDTHLDVCKGVICQLPGNNPGSLLICEMPDHGNNCSSEKKE